ncbi:hypothetical protein DN069_15655 [Streptacidiphilus pinicola]|uniref:Uncharacterized protein n=1 Tax=Streptacidiphilus pinicola TaxID=2219663 RepID=A0A2X0ILX5_9ACTN|nr:hypothetical protein [Streptacidiphilus pinicola]RAG84613.1 hypothetical protein DN069_15655 [Streptacidiphilus pinicola]
MSAVMVGVTTGALSSAGFAISAWVAHRWRSPKSDFKRADRFAREMDLYLPEEMVTSVAARLRQRTVLALTVSALLGGPVLGYLVGTFVATLDTPVDRFDFQAVRFPGPAAIVIGPVFGVLMTALESVWELARVRRQAATAAAFLPQPPVAIRLRNIVPLWLVWAARVLAVSPALLAALACAAQRRTGLALGFVALAPVCGLISWSVERAQLWMLNTRRQTGQGQPAAAVAAFDDAFRVAAVLPFLLLAPCVSVFVGAFYIHLVGRGLWYQNLLFAWSGTVFPILAMNGLLSANWAKRYHRRRARPETSTPTAAS